MENAEEVFQFLEEFTKRRPKVIPRELEDYLNFVAATGDPIYQWSLVKNLFKEKLLSVITEFYETSPGLDIPHCPNVDIFSYETMKNNLLEKIDAFPSAPFTIQRICELLTAPRKQYSRIDKFMRAFEKNILVVSTRDPGPLRHTESENGEAAESMVNGSDSNSEYNVDVEMEDISSWKENTDNLHGYAVQSGSSTTGRTQPEADNVPYAAQNGPAATDRPAVARVELMTIEADANVSSIAEDLPESSTSDSDLSPPEPDGKQNEDSDSDKSDVSPISSVITVLPADSVNSPTADLQPESTSTSHEKPIVISESSITTSDSIVSEHKAVHDETEFEAASSSIEVDDNITQETEDKENTSPSSPTVPSPDTDDDKCSESDRVTESIPVVREPEPDQLPDTSSDKKSIVEEDSTSTDDLVSDSRNIDDDMLCKTEIETSEVTPSLEPSVVTTSNESVSDVSDRFTVETSDSKVVDSTVEYPTASPGDVDEMKSTDPPSSRESSPVESLSDPIVDTSSAPVESSTGSECPRVAENLPESTSDDSNNDSEMSSTDDLNSAVVSNSYTTPADTVESMTEDVEAVVVSNSTAVSNSSPITNADDPIVTDSTETTSSVPDKSEASGSPPAPIVSSQTDDTPHS